MPPSTSVSLLPSDPYFALNNFLNEQLNDDGASMDMETMNATSSNTESTQMSTESTLLAKGRDETMTPESECTPSVLSDATPQRSRKRSSISSQDHSDILREFINRKQPNPMDFLPPKPPAPKDNLQQFFESIASTMRSFPPLSIAKIKLQISKIVGEEEVACAERNAAVEIIYIENTNEAEKQTECTAEPNDSNE